MSDEMDSGRSSTMFKELTRKGIGVTFIPVAAGVVLLVLAFLLMVIPGVAFGADNTVTVTGIIVFVVLVAGVVILLAGIRSFLNILGTILAAVTGESSSSAGQPGISSRVASTVLPGAARGSRGSPIILRERSPGTGEHLTGVSGTTGAPVGVSPSISAVSRQSETGGTGEIPGPSSMAGDVSGGLENEGQRAVATSNVGGTGLPVEQGQDGSSVAIGLSFEDALQRIIDRYNDEKVRSKFRGWNESLVMNFTDLEKSYVYRINGSDGIELVEGTDEDAAVQVTMDSELFKKLLARQVNAIKAYSSGRLKVKGAMKDLLKLRKLMF